MTGPLGMDNGHEDSTLLYNEYVVYDTNQVRIRYLVKVFISVWLLPLVTVVSS